jgi:hypothetical protein
MGSFPKTGVDIAFPLAVNIFSRVWDLLDMLLTRFRL